MPTPRARVIRAAEALGYQPEPDRAQPQDRQVRPRSGWSLPDLTNPLFPPIVRGIEDVLGPAGYSAWIVNTDNDPSREQAQVESLRSRQVEGLIVATARLEHPLLEQLHAQGVRMVLVNRRLDDLDLPSVTADDAFGIGWRSTTWPGSATAGSPTWPGRRTPPPASSAPAPSGSAVRDHGLADDPALVADVRLLDRGRRGRGRCAGCSTPASTSPRSSRATTCSRSAATTCSPSAACTAPTTSASWASTTCRSWTSCGRR